MDIKINYKYQCKELCKDLTIGDFYKVHEIHIDQFEDKVYYLIKNDRNESQGFNELSFKNFFHVEPVEEKRDLELERQILEKYEYGKPLDYGKVNTSPTGSLRYNEGKPEVSQLDPKFILDLADLITKSAEKYGRGNYAKGQMFSTPFDSCMRHLLKFQSGESFDDESLQHHLLHSAANIMILYNSWLKDNPELDDRIDFDA